MSLILKDIGTDFLSVAPKTKEHLYFYCTKFFQNADIPFPNYCKNHISPLEAIADAFFEKEDFLIFYAARGTGKTYILSMLSYLESVFKPNCGINILSGSLEQAVRAVQYLKEFWDLPHAPRHMLVNNQVVGRGYRLTNGSYVQALAASQKSARGAHPQKLRIDEADELDEKIYQAALGQPKTKYGIKDNIIVSSTLHNAFGLMSDIIDSREERGAKLYPWCIKDVCEPYGFWKKSEILRRKRQTTKAMWESEYLCKRPKIGDSIYDFETIDRSYRRGMQIEFKKDQMSEASIDWGHTCTVMHIIQNMKEHYNVPNSYQWDYEELTNRCEEIVEIAKDKNVYVIYADSAPKDANVTLKKIIKKKHARITLVPVSFNRWKEVGIDVIRYFLERDLINIKDKELQDKLKKYHYANTDKEIIAKEDDHHPDALVPWAASKYKILK
jgi:hypothetical protein